jgi:uncharacterized membrane protein
MVDDGRMVGSKKIVYLTCQNTQVAMYRKIAPLFYLTFLGFIVGVLLYASRDQNNPVDQFHMRQSIGLYITALCCHFIFTLFNSNLISFEIPSLLVFIPLFILWVMGFNNAMNGQEKPLPVIGRLYQKLFGFVAREAEKD